MVDVDNSEELLGSRIQALEEELWNLRLKRSHLRRAQKEESTTEQEALPLEHQEYIRYGRQMILPEIGLPGQLSLKKASVLVIGAGGLGCPALLYLVGAGIGTIGIADKDHVDLSNLHRQVLHNTASIGDPKARSAERALKELNPAVTIIRHDDGITAQNAVYMIQQYDVIVDCTDSPATRYLISDSAVICSKPLVSGSALGTEGQITVYCYRGGPCYRCVFPIPPPAESVLTCGEGGILGPVVGVIGVMQALEVIKIIVHQHEQADYKASMTVFAAFDNPQWRTFRLRPRKQDCIACGADPSITADTIRDMNYEMLCARQDPGENIERISVKEYLSVRSQDHTLIDVRDHTQFGICHLPNSISISRIIADLIALDIPFTAFTEDAESVLAEIPREKPVYVVCRFGNDSQLVVNTMKTIENGFSDVKDLKGGLNAWAETFPTGIIPKY